MHGRIHTDRMSEFEPRYGWEGDKKFFISDMFFVKGSADKESIRKESTFLSQVQASNLFPELIEVYENSEYAYIGLRRVKGKTLREFWDDGEKFTMLDKMFVIDGVWSAIQFLITQNIVHGSINEDNILYNVDTKNVIVLGIGKRSHMFYGVTDNDLFGEGQGFQYLVNWLKYH
jgi:serine/threonine protein kinase